MLITIVSPCRNYDAQNVEINLKETLMFICMQKKTSALTSFFGFLRMGTLRMLDHSPSNIIVSICRKISYLCACKISTSSLTSFLRSCNSKLNILDNLDMPGHTHLK